MPQFHELEVTNIRKTIRDAVVVTLKPKSGRFDFIQGQYLTFRQNIQGTDIRRSYSICTGLDDGHLQVGIKKVDGGAFSTWANDTLEIGMTLQAMPPAGKFHTPINPDQGKTYLAFAGGSGITPILSILKTTLTREPQSRFTLVYANRGVSTIMFRDELEDLKNTYMGRLSILHILESDAHEIELFTGRVTSEKCKALFSQWIDIASVDMTFICGPEPMMLGIVSALKEHGLNDDQIKFELFASSQPGRLDRKPSSGKTKATQQVTQATFHIDGTARNVIMTKDQTLLQAALDNALDPPFACKAGVCSTCMCKLTEGEVEMVANHALEDYEVAQGYVLACQSYPLTDQLTIEYEGH